MTSPGIRSGVNCSRLPSSDSALASVLISSVLATPGTPSSSTCPSQISAMSSPLTTESWPTTALATSARTWPSAALGASGAAAVQPAAGTWSSAITGRIPLFRVRQDYGRGAPARHRCPAAGRTGSRAISCWPRPDLGRDCRGHRLRPERPWPGRARAAAWPSRSSRSAAAALPRRPPGLIERRVPFDGLRGPDDDRQPLGDQRAEPAPAPEPEQHDRDAELDHDQPGLPGDQCRTWRGGATWPGRPAREHRFWRQPDDPPVRGEQVERERRVPVPGQPAVGQQRAATENRDGAASGPQRDHRGEALDQIARLGSRRRAVAAAPDVGRSCQGGRPEPRSRASAAGRRAGRPVVHADPRGQRGQGVRDPARPRTGRP